MSHYIILTISASSDADEDSYCTSYPLLGALFVGEITY